MISFGNVYLVDTKSAEAALASQIPLRESFQFYRWRKLSNANYDPSNSINWFLEKRVEPGRYFHPWGAGRWSYGQFVIDQEMLDAIRLQAYVGDNYRALPLVIDDAVGGTITTDLFMLSPIPLQKISTPFNLYLMTLVDQRYFFFERAAEIEVIEGTTSWEGLYAAIASALGITLSVDPVSADYLKPSGCLTQRYEYLPMLLDHVAASCGQRIVRTLAGTFHARNASTAKSLVSSQAPLYRRFAGGSVDVNADAPGNVPSSVLIKFPRADFGTETGAAHQITITLSGLGIFEYSGATSRTGKYIVHDTAIANFTGGVNPANVTQLTALSQRIARDFYTWRLASLEVRYEKAVPWIVDGMHDITWCHDTCISTNLTRSEWDVEFGKLMHAGAYGSESCDDHIPDGMFLGIAVGPITGRVITTTTIASLTAVFLIGDSVVPASYTSLMPVNKPFTVRIGTEEMTLVFDGATVTATCRGANGTTEANHNPFDDIVWKRLTLGEGDVNVLSPSAQADNAFDTVDTCRTLHVYNPCEQIANRMLVQVWPESESGRLIASVLCAAPVDVPSPVACDECPDCFSVTFGGITNGGCTGCADSAAVPVTLTQTGSCDYYYNSYGCVGDDCFSLCGFNYTVVRFYKSGENEWTLLVDDSGVVTTVPIVAMYTADTTGWNCTDPLVMNRITPSGTGLDASGYCQTWPATVTVEPCGSPGGIPTVHFDDANICQDDTTVTIAGTGFETGTPANNIVTFNLGASGTTTSATSTLLTVTFSVNPTSLGALTAIVTNVNGSSGSAVQIATVADCAVLPTIEETPADFCPASLEIIITGTNFDTIPLNNTVAFNLGAMGVVTAATSTQLTVAIISPPTSFGVLTAIVTNSGGVSSPIQVGTVIDCNPTVDFSDADLCQDALTVIITGTHFETTPGNNTVIFNLGAAGTVTSATETSLTVTFTTNPTSLGALTCEVLNVNGSSVTVQVGTVIECASVTVDCCDNPVSEILTAVVTGCITENVELTYSDLGGGLSVWNGNITECGDAVALQLRCDSGVWELWWSGGAVTDSRTNSPGDPMTFGPSSALETLGCCGAGQTVTVTFNDVICN
jgi:hypothetical protein